MGRPLKYLSEAERLEAKRAQNRRSAQLKRRQTAGLEPETPLYSTHAGERATRGKLTSAQIEEIRSLHIREDWTLETLARKFSVSASAISAILRGKSWKQ